MSDIWKNPHQRFGFIIVNVVAGECEPHDYELFFGPTHPNDIRVDVPATWHVSKLLAHLGIFDSAKDAERRGYRGPIPNGFTDLLNITQSRHRVTMLRVAEQSTGE